MAKNIVICCDGTNNKFGKVNTNVVKLYSLLNNTKNQVSFYDPGVGTFSSLPVSTRSAKFVSKLLGLAFGLGITQNIEEAYSYLMKTYEPGDQIYLFGFSRGAYTVRALAALIHKCGILEKHNDQLIEYAIKLFKEAQNDEISEDFKKTFSVNASIHFLGLWDTVSSVGWVWNPVVLPYTTNNPSVNIVRHAISIDERRAFFRQNLIGDRVTSQDRKQVWFPGVHSDVGGGYNPGKNGLSKIALEWMLKEAQQAGLSLKPKKEIKKIVNYTLPITNSEFVRNKSLKIWWLPFEIFPKMSFNSWINRSIPKLNFGRKRRIQDNVTVHQSVIDLGVENFSNLPEKLNSEPWNRYK